MLMKPTFTLLGCHFNFGSDRPNAKVSVDVALERRLLGCCAMSILRYRFSYKNTEFIQISD
jgi:hypothetical protein